MTDMNMPDLWLNEANLVEHLAEQLILGRLGLFLGAGVSNDFDLPDWKTLVRRIAVAKGEPNPLNDFDPVEKAGALKVRFGSDEAFNAAVKDALYQGRTLDFAKISENRLLSAIGSLVMASQRGSAAKVFTLNFDDLLELYLEFHGFTTAIVHNGCHWARNEDVVVYHPHGFLPLGHDVDSESIVLGTTDFHKIMTSDEWRPVIETSLRQHTFLYLGLSGDDMHLRSHWTELGNHHAIKDDRVCYHGVRFTTGSPDNDVGTLTKDWGIYTHVLDNYGQLPEFLFKICQKARDIRTTST